MTRIQKSGFCENPTFQALTAALRCAILWQNTDSGQGAPVVPSRELPEGARQPEAAPPAPLEFPAGNGRAVSPVIVQ
jgi:hypothetical protein